MKISNEAVGQLFRLADDMEAAISGGPEFIGRTGLRSNASQRIRRIIAVESEWTNDADK